jgi:hypothetical protein
VSARRSGRGNDPQAKAASSNPATVEEFRQWLHEHARADEALPAVLAAAGTTQWRVYCWDAGQWQPAGMACDSREAADAKLAGLSQRHPEFIGRVVRETTTYTIEGEQR